MSPQRTLLPCVAGMYLAACCAAAPSGPWTLKPDFESGMRQGWESFPLAQDAGYDPTLDPVVYQGRKALERHKAPTRDGRLQIGFIHKVRTKAGAHPRLAFVYAIPSAGDARLEVNVFTGGVPKLYSLPARTGAWTEHSLSLTDLGPGTEIRAVSISAVFLAAQEDRIERFLIDDVRLSVERERDLTVNSPENFWDEDRRLHYVRRAYSPGDDLQLQTAAPGAQVRLYDPDNRMVHQGTGIAPLHRFTATDPVGIWRAEVDSPEGRATLLLLMEPSQRRGLLFDQLPPASKELLNLLSDRVTRLRKTVHPEFGPNIATYNDRQLLPGLPSYFALLQPPSELAVLEALQYKHSGSQESLANARKILLSMSSWPTWVHPWFPAHGYRTYYPVGIVAAHLALTVDLLRDQLSRPEMEAVDRGLLEKAIVPAFQEYVLNDRIIFHTSNWIGHATGGPLLAALASRDPKVAGYALGLFTKQREHIEATYTEDGSYGEGVSYMKFDMQTSSLAAAASKRHLGQNLDAPLTRSWRHLLYTAYGKGEGLDHGDSHAGIHPFGVYAYAAAQNTDSVLNRAYLDSRDPSANSLLSRILWEGLVRPLTGALGLPRSAVFPIRGAAVLRSGWEPEATVVNIRLGANFNHNHADQGSLSIAHGGEVLIDEAGFSDYYKDPYYQPYVIQALGHNTLLIDDNPESQVIPGNRFLGNHPRISASQLGEQFDYIEGDLTPAYGGLLSSYTRTLLYRKGGPLIVLDHVRSPQPHRFSVLWHPMAPAELAKAGPVEVRKGEAALDLQVFGSSDLQAISTPAPLLLSQFEKSETAVVRRLPILNYGTVKPTTEALFVSVLQPRRASEAPVRFQWTTTNAGYRLAVGGEVVEVDTRSGIKLALGESQWPSGR